MDVPPLERLALLLEAATPDVLKAWLDHRARFAQCYLERLDLFNRNKERFPPRWQEERLLFVPFAGIAPTAVDEMKQRVAQALRTYSPDKADTRSAFGRQVRENATPSPGILGLCQHAIQVWAEQGIKCLLDATAICNFPDHTIRSDLVRAHWVMLRGEVERWTSRTTMTVMSKWDVATVITLTQSFDKAPMHGIKTLRAIYGWDLQETRDAWFQHSQPAQLP